MGFVDRRGGRARILIADGRQRDPAAAAVRARLTVRQTIRFPVERAMWSVGREPRLPTPIVAQAGASPSFSDELSA
jgi:hypothetical protein